MAARASREQKIRQPTIRVVETRAVIPPTVRMVREQTNRAVMVLAVVRTALEIRIPHQSPIVR